MVDSWDICTTWNAHKEGGLMAITFFNSWIWITCIPLMVNICDKKRHLMLFILPYFHDKLIPIMTPVTFDGSLTKKCGCLHRNVRQSMKLIFYVPTMSQYILNVMIIDYCSIFSVNVLQMWLAKMEILFICKYFQKIHQIHKPGSHTPGFVQMNLN